ncbi:MAG: HDOD domain-containing protein [Phycisphaerae bacterium]|nr:HDOD domain-containing protein [Phycisphaerae bacterium]
MNPTMAPGNSDAATIVNSAIHGIGEIATLPEITVRIISIVEDPKSTARDLHGVIKNDPALATKILKVVNSAFYGLPGQISNLDRAIILLGLSAVKNIAIAASMTRMFQGGTSIEGFSGMDLWRHSAAVGVASRAIATIQGAICLEEMFLAGLIHDLGLLVERQALPKKIAEVIARYKAAPKKFCTIEEEVIGADHQAFGQALATKWRFPRSLTTVIGYHHKPQLLAAEFRPITDIVHVADILACKAGLGFSLTAGFDDVTPELLESVSLSQSDADRIIAELPEHVTAAETLFHS